MEVSEDFTITLRIGKRIFPVTIKRTEEEAYRKAVERVNNRYNKYATLYPSLDHDTYVCMAALSIALTLERYEISNDTQPFIDGMKRMLASMEKIMGTKGTE